MEEMKITSAKILPGWKWIDYDDGSGHLQSPSGERYFGYDLQPYAIIGGIEYEWFDGYYYVYCGSLKSFKTYAEKLIKTNMWRLK